jgi:hypothetical protein
VLERTHSHHKGTTNTHTYFPASKTQLDGRSRRRKAC